MRYLRLLFLFWRQSLIREMMYPQNFLFLFLVQVFGFVVQLIGLEVAFSHTTVLVGWSKGGALALLAVFGIVYNLLKILFEGSFTRFCLDVHTGTFDVYLTRPVGVRFLISFGRLALEYVGGLLFNIGLLLFLILNGMIAVTASSFIGFFILLFIGIAIGYFLWFAMTLFIFWAPNIEHFTYLYGTVLSIVRYPLEIYGKAARRLFLTLLPLGFLVAVPTEFLIGVGSWHGFIFAGFVTMLIALFTQYWWRFAIRRYASASS